MSSKFESRPQQCRIGLDECRAVVLDQFGRRQGPVELLQLWFVVKQFQMARRTSHEQKDDVFGLAERNAGRFGCRQSLAMRRGGCLWRPTMDCSAMEPSPIPHSCRNQRRARMRRSLDTRWHAERNFRSFSPLAFWLLPIQTSSTTFPCGHSFVIVSSRFRITRQTAVQAAISATLMAGNGGRSSRQPTPANCLKPLEPRFRDLKRRSGLFQKLSQSFRFRRRGLARQAPTLQTAIIQALACHLWTRRRACPRPEPGPLNKQRFIQGRQRLQRRVRPRPSGTARSVPSGASNAESTGYGIERNRKVYRPRRYLSGPKSRSQLLGP